MPIFTFLVSTKCLNFNVPIVDNYIITPLIKEKSTRLYISRYLFRFILHVRRNPYINTQIILELLNIIETSSKLTEMQNEKCTIQEINHNDVQNLNSFQHVLILHRYIIWSIEQTVVWYITYNKCELTLNWA